MAADYRDAVIEALADSEAALRAHISMSENQAGAYRTIAFAAIARMALLAGQLDDMSRRHTRLVEEYRNYRASTIRNEAA